MAPSSSEPDLAVRIRRAVGSRRQADIAASMEVTQATVSRWISGEVVPGREAVRRLAELLAVPVAWLETGAGPDPTIDIEAEREAYRATTGWRFREAPRDRGRDYGNPNVHAFPPDLKTLLRESVQNVLDQRLGGTAEVTISLISLSGGARDQFLTAMSWDELGPHVVAAGKQDQKMARRLRAGLSRLQDPSHPLQLLRIEDRRTTGLIGGESDGNFAALCRNNLDSHKEDASGAGGSHGLGKATVVRASAINTVMFSSNLSVPDPEHHRTECRVFGRTELVWREIPDGRQWAGPGWFGVPVESMDDVDSSWGQRVLAKDLHLDRPVGVSGTTVLVVGFEDPDVEGASDPDAFVDAAAEIISTEFWKPLHDGQLVVETQAVEGPDERVTKQRAVDASATRAGYVAAASRWKEQACVEALLDADDVVAVTVPLEVPARTGAEPHEMFRHEAVVLVRRAESSDGEDIGKIAYHRGFGMTVLTETPSGRRIGARPWQAVVLAGTAVDDSPASRRVERFLREAEPPAHNDWELTDDLRANYARGSGTSLRRFREDVRAAVLALVRPPEPPPTGGPEDLRRLLRIGTDRGDPPPRAPRVTSITGGLRDDRWVLDEVRVSSARGSGDWIARPVLVVAAETGSGTSVPIVDAEPLKLCEREGEFLRFSGGQTATFRASVGADELPVPPAEAPIRVVLTQLSRAEDLAE